jgi:hypothetical protein
MFHNGPQLFRMQNEMNKGDILTFCVFMTTVIYLNNIIFRRFYEKNYYR